MVSFDTHDILASELEDNGTITLQLGDVVTNQVWSSRAMVAAPTGYYARPSKPTVGTQAAQARLMKTGTVDIVFGSRDSRQAEAYGNLAEGEICLAAGGADGYAMGKLLIKADGSLVMSTTDNNTHDGNGCYMKVGPDGWHLIFPFGQIHFIKQGLFITHESGATFKLGAFNNPTSPNFISLNASKVKIDSPMTTIGPTIKNGGKGVFMAPVVAPVASVETGVPTIIGGGIGVVMGETANGVLFGT